MCAEKVHECPSNLTGFTPIPAITFEDDTTKRSIIMNLLPTDVESFPEDIKTGFCYKTLADDEEVFYYHESVKTKFTELLKSKMTNIPAAIFNASTAVSSGNIVTLDDAYWQTLATKEEIEKMAATPPPQLDLKKSFDGDWILIRSPLDGRLIAQLRAAMQDAENKILRRGIIDNSYFVTADMETLTRLNALIYFVQIEMERSGKEPELLERFSKKVAYEFTTYAFDILQKREEEKDVWIREIIGWGAIALIFGVAVTLLQKWVMGREHRPGPFDPNSPGYRRLVDDVAERLRPKAKPTEGITSRLDGGDANRPAPEGVIDLAERVRAGAEGVKAAAETLRRVEKFDKTAKESLRRARER